MDDLLKKEMRFQGARDVIDSLIGNRSVWVYEEKHNAAPDLAPGLKL